MEHEGASDMGSNPAKTVLISGAGIAGPALAFWLEKRGFAPTVVERAQDVRVAGHAVDFRGVSREVLRRMDLLPAIEAEATHQGDMHYVDARDRTRAVMPANFASGEIEIMRGDLARILYEATKERVEYRFGDAIAELAEDADGVGVTFASGETRRFDLVVGADGQHSGVRRLAFGPETAFLHHLGLYLAVARIPNLLDLDYSGKMFNAPGTILSVYPARANSEARALFFFHADALDYDYRDTEAQKRIVAERYAGQGWDVPRIVPEMLASQEFYFDSVSQVRMEKWSKGRVALLGDAAFCATPLSGMGSGMAVTGAYVLAEELARAGGDHAAGFARYEARMRPFVNKSQKLAQMATHGYVPTSPLGIRFMHLMNRLVALLPGDMILKPAIDAANSVVLDG
jgi:2-polyprenyl-6-methoxyphenol hydroxylase-like FAD-dependent oxidoreductase